ncbi:MAG: hypothetical protein CEE42_12235 [Promethearchaeota archaeon Loki_b31]|nr:MAG: hypothetical protein CEE42_12235 [Candidatus Lokiarchaeota archaeon Loki_b31]
MLLLETNINSSKIIQKIKNEQNIKFEQLENWIVAGSGNYEKTQNDGRYRSSCNTYRDSITCESHKIKGLKIRFNHCNKLDCTSCFIHASSARARKINNKILKLQRVARNRGIKIGNVIHLVLSPKPEFFLSQLKDYESVKKLRRKIFRMLKNAGIFAGVMFTQLHSIKCKKCGKPDETCACKDKQLIRALNIHFHVLGYGYLINSEEFRKKNKGWMYVNFGRRKDAYSTIFYILTRVSIWRKNDGKLNPAYQIFGWLKSNKFVPIKQRVVYERDKCPICKKARKKILDGVKYIKNQESDKVAFSSIDRINELKAESKNKLIKDTIDQKTKKRVFIEVSEKDLVLGKEIFYKRIEVEYEFKNVDELRRITTINKMRYRKDKRENENFKEGNGYG